MRGIKEEVEKGEKQKNRSSRFFWIKKAYSASSLSLSRPSHCILWPKRAMVKNPPQTPGTVNNAPQATKAKTGMMVKINWIMGPQ
ncbi:MAG: hypothetical protein A2527_05110 [Candidatus Lambdaproteobacteria bacterium RIFOXYD2_FULL_50_16]|uniref:Uncharacterized protein n=1 Tax=Candidatus Lambdaproteobacteria bacterium RIFOXYD2_FULL_50_16 TaxID=1817772 RepID=A0A1F6G9V8_9PROT|nr:MAG: hypothetical protein A2527_05110 [Candidatus Lambdaproteobacteria bacterium RIFOXYD2_FULL_50_16]